MRIPTIRETVKATEIITTLAACCLCAGTAMAKGSAPKPPQDAFRKPDTRHDGRLSKEAARQPDEILSGNGTEHANRNSCCLCHVRDLLRPCPMNPLAIIVCAILIAQPLAAKPLPVGASRFILPAADPIEVFTYKPPGFHGGPLLVVFHGVDRNAEEYRSQAICMAEKFKAIVVAPRFDAARFKSERYQFGGVLRNGKPQPRDQWTYAMIPRLVAFVRAGEGGGNMPYYLIGHSAGGQFLARMAAFQPGDACRIVASNPSSYLFPTRDLPFGYGFGKLPPELNGDEAMRAYLAAPLTLYLGACDKGATAHFDDSPTAMKQGASRLERGRACFEMARQLAVRRKWAFNWRKIEKPGVGHSASGMFAAKEVGDALFGFSAPPASRQTGPHPGRLSSRGKLHRHVSRNPGHHPSSVHPLPLRQ